MGKGRLLTYTYSVSLRLRSIAAWLLLSIFFFFCNCSAGELSEGNFTKYFSRAGDDSMFQVGEELTYNVSYTFIDIGQVRIKVVDKVKENGRTVYKTIAHIDSYKGLPFVDLHTIYESAVSESIYATHFRSRTKTDADYRYFIYNYDYPGHSIYIEQGMINTGKVEHRDTLQIDTLTQDGLSLFFLARSRVQSGQTMNIPTVVSEKKGSTLIEFKNEGTKEKIDAVDYPIDVIHFEGRADFVGIFGLTGDFEGWFSNDDARVPILAKMKVILGNIRIELMKWNRANWTPPRFEEGSSK